MNALHPGASREPLTFAELPLCEDTLVHRARAHARDIGDRPFLLWLDNGSTEASAYTYAELDRKARALAVQIRAALALDTQAALQDERPPTALIVTRHGLEFALAFFGCLYAGVAAVPAYPLKKGEPDARLRALLDNCGARLVISDASSTPSTDFARTLAPRATLLLVDDVDAARAAQWRFPAIDADSVAFIQYTSGSTGAPKGVVVTHGNLMCNQRMITAAMGHGAHTVFVGWLPLFHDMGLVGNLLNPFYLGVRCVLMSPYSFIVNPIRWLQAISKYRATTSGGPNFAYELCLQRTSADQRRALDLSSWQIAFNGAEPVRATTLERFAATFREHGFRPSAFYPCYGMAETTLMVTGVDPAREPALLDVEREALELGEVLPAAAGDGVALVSSGRAVPQCELRIVDPASAEALAEDRVGEIWVRSPSVGREYYGQPELSAFTFGAQLRGEERSAGGFLRTGDLGFLHGGELYVTGRMKDLIIINGRNHYPQDIELSALQAHAALQGSMAAAFSVDARDAERLVLALAASERLLQSLPLAEVVRAITRSVTQHHGVEIEDLVILGGRLPTTSSGKIRRSRCRQLYLDQGFGHVFYSSRRDGRCGTPALAVEAS